ncbi:Glycosyltransferase involved in cell wall bisynthesis [Psychrobacillus psychrotolerans]|uniref:Glycosyltransferase involved in cell wall bisynthesis n=1 Tax=Psychrobacillus psychrotolerans TaxID=126156 RepID=A0A1I6A1L7_9BACI|nr:glycosyltransferase [Psychrobacillus psychrotolerans]SFQ62609.1 Glycosyltransferase involved in cell wall bisynthesis [Psychrobacillus psychrotolerans]
MQSKEITVSVGLIVYNHEKYLRQAIESILMQEVNFKYEIIVGDDKSTDNSRKIILEYKEKYPDKFVLKFKEQNVGGTKNFYDVFMESKGKYIATLEGDDYWIDNKKLQKTVNFLEDNSTYLGVSHVIEARDFEGNYMSRHPNSSKIVGKEATINLFLEGYYFSAVATVFRNIFLDRTQDYAIYYKAHKFVGDLTLCLLLLDKGKIKVLDEVMSVYRFRRVDGESNYNSIRNAIEQYNDHIDILNALDHHFENKYDFTREYLMRSSNIFTYCIKQNKLIDFYTVFKKVPYKSKVIFCGYFPLQTLKFLFRKLITK